MTDSIAIELACPPELRGDVPLFSNQLDFAEAAEKDSTRRSLHWLAADGPAPGATIPPSDLALWGRLGNWDF